MSILTACQSAAARLIGRRPQAIFSSTETFDLEIAELVVEVAKDIAATHDWQLLTQIHTISGDGSTAEFDLPDDYDRQLIRSDVIDTGNLWGYTRVTDINEWIRLTEQGISALPGNWILYGGKMHFSPPPPSGAVAMFPYVSSNIAVTEGGVVKAAPTADSDDFRLSARLLSLGLIWRWREMKRLDYGADQAAFEKAFNEMAGRDKGSRIFKTGPQRFPANAAMAYPHPLGT